MTKCTKGLSCLSLGAIYKINGLPGGLVIKSFELSEPLPLQWKRHDLTGAGCSDDSEAHPNALV